MQAATGAILKFYNFQYAKELFLYTLVADRTLYNHYFYPV